MELSKIDKRLILSARKKGMKGLTKEEISAFMKYKKILEIEKKNKLKHSKTKNNKESSMSSKELRLTAEDKKLILEAKKMGMRGLTTKHKIAINKYKTILSSMKEKKKSGEKKLPVIDREIPDLPIIKREHFGKFKNKYLLIAEDNVINRKMIAAILSNSGIKIDFAENGKVLLDKLSKSMKCDMILMDIEMPEIDGIEATKVIRRDNKYNYLPIIALTSATEKDEYRNIISSGMNAYLSKPVVLGKLYNVFRLFLGDKR